jgi:hypothetical protein
LFSPSTHFGVGFYGGAYGDNYYEVRQGRFDAIRDGRDEGGHSVGVLLQYDFERHKRRSRN